jgi:hypothetical protein
MVERRKHRAPTSTFVGSRKTTYLYFGAILASLCLLAVYLYVRVQPPNSVQNTRQSTRDNKLTSVAKLIPQEIPPGHGILPSGIAPPLKDIQRELTRITGIELNPSGVRRGSLSQEQLTMLEEYTRTLIGKEVQSWYGQVKDVTPDKDFYLEHTAEYKKPPSFIAEVKVPVDYSAERVVLTEHEVTVSVYVYLDLSQVENLHAWRDPTSYTQSPMQRVQLSGIIGHVSAFDSITILNGLIDRVE